MISLPPVFEERMQRVLETEYEAFLEALRAPSPVTVRMNAGKLAAPTFPDTTPVAWCPTAFYLRERPVFTLDPCFHGGGYYVQEASSMFIDYILRQILPKYGVRALDLCAAPGGKSTLMASALPAGSVLVANEVIRSRASILKENIVRWGHDNVVVTRSDPSDFTALEGAFDVMLVDAPCSGEGMFRKDVGAIGEWSESNALLCSERQKRIIGDAWDALAPEGYLIYSTCTYNREENEGVAEWIMNRFDASSVCISHCFDSITASDSDRVHGYRFYPHRTQGEGFFVTVVQKHGGREWSPRRGKKQGRVKAPILPREIAGFIGSPQEFSCYANGDLFGIVPAIHEEFIGELESRLRVIYKGCELAEMYQKKLKLSHSLALYKGLNKEAFRVLPTDLRTALTYLKKEDIVAEAEAGAWILIEYGGVGIGWAKSLGNRLNNYFPKEWRIRMKVEG